MAPAMDERRTAAEARAAHAAAADHELQIKAVADLARKHVGQIFSEHATGAEDYPRRIAAGVIRHRIEGAIAELHRDLEASGADVTLEQLQDEWAELCATRSSQETDAGGPPRPGEPGTKPAVERT